MSECVERDEEPEFVFDVGIQVENGKYRLHMKENDWRIHVQRYGRDWVVVEEGANAVRALMIERAKERVQELPQETEKVRRERLASLLEQLDVSGGSVFLDLCEILLLLSERVDGSIRWEHPRVSVYIRQKKAAERIAKKRREER